MAASVSDALVIFGASGDLAHKMIFPALYAIVKHGTLKVPVIGVALPKWSPERLHQRVTENIERSGRIDDRSALKHLLSAMNVRGRRSGRDHRRRTALSIRALRSLPSCRGSLA